MVQQVGVLGMAGSVKVSLKLISDLNKMTSIMPMVMVAATIAATVAAKIASCMHCTMLFIVEIDIGSYSDTAARYSQISRPTIPIAIRQSLKDIVCELPRKPN